MLIFDKFHKPMNEDSAHKEALFVCGIFFMGISKKRELFMEETKKHRTCLFSSWREPTPCPSADSLWRMEGVCRFPRIVISSEREKSFSFAVKQQL